MYWMDLPPVHRDRARIFRSDALPGVEALHATFVEYRYALHTHEAHTIALVDRGAAAFDLEGHTYRAPMGSVFSIPAGWAHTGESATPAGYSYRVLYVSPSVILNELELPSRAARRRSREVVRSAAPLARRLSAFHDRLSGVNLDLEAEEMGWAVLARVASDLVLEADLPTTRGIDHAAVRRAALYLQEHWNQRAASVPGEWHGSVPPRPLRSERSDARTRPSNNRPTVDFDTLTLDQRTALMAALVAYDNVVDVDLTPLLAGYPLSVARVMIPDACNALNVPCISTFEFLRRENVSFRLKWRTAGEPCAVGVVRADATKYGGRCAILMRAVYRRPVGDLDTMGFFLRGRERAAFPKATPTD